MIFQVSDVRRHTRNADDVEIGSREEVEVVPISSVRINGIAAEWWLW